MHIHICERHDTYQGTMLQCKTLIKNGAI